MKYCIVVPWHDGVVIDSFLDAWGIRHDHKERDWLILQQDIKGEGCAKTKNKGIQKALERGAEVVMVLDSDCYPMLQGDKLEKWAEDHLESLKPKPVQLYDVITDPPSRGTPYLNRTVTMPVAASMGFWITNPDYDAIGQLMHKLTPMHHFGSPKFWRFFAFSGMNCAFKRGFVTWFDEEAERFDDIFMGYKLQSEAYKSNHCLSLSGPTVRHIRQSNVWKNLAVEVKNMERNETEWQKYI